MPIANLPVADAYARQRQGATLVDVRSTREYAAGRPAGAVNVPLLEHDEDTGQLVPNPDFVRVMRANFPLDAPLLISCQSGNRSARAAQMLEAFGFSNLANVLGGFCGASSSPPIHPGWEAAGLPVASTPTSAGSYEELKRKADEQT